MSEEKRLSTQAVGKLSEPKDRKVERLEGRVNEMATGLLGDEAADDPAVEEITAHFSKGL